MAVVEIGMRPADARGLTLSLMARILEEHARRRRRETLERWDLMRHHACLTMQPHLTQPLTPRELLPIPELDGEGKGGEKKPRRDITPEERRRRMEEIRRLYEKDKETWQETRSL